MLSLRQLEVLRAVMRVRTTVGAAREIGMSQPAVSNAIRSMEAALGFPLFDRVNNRLIPTEEALSLHADSEPLFLMLRGIRQRAGDLRVGRVGRLRLAATAELSDSFLPQGLARFMPHHPRVAVAIEVQTMAEMLDALDAGLTQCGLVMEPDTRPTIELRPLARLDMVCACPPGSPLAALPVVTPLDLAGLRLIAAPEGTRVHALVQDSFRRAGQPFAPSIEVRFMNAGMRLVEQGLGAMIADPLTARAHGRVAVRPFHPAAPITVYAALPAGQPAPRLVASFLRHAADAMAGLSSASLFGDGTYSPAA